MSNQVITIVGTVFKSDIGLEAWGIRSLSGEEFRPLNFPDQLKYPQTKVTVLGRLVSEDMSIHMWGKPIIIISFNTTVEELS